MLVRYAAFNLIGLGAPLIAALIAIPALIHGLGAERFGLLTIIWAVVSYFGLFDLGIGRALTQQVAILFNNGRADRAGTLVWTAVSLMFVLGLGAGVLLALLTPWGVSVLRDVPDRQEVIEAAYAMAWSMPFIVLTSGFRGVLEARFHFGIINLIRVPAGLWTFLAPLAVVLYWEPRLDLIAWTLTAGRFFFGTLHGYFAWRAIPAIGMRPNIDTQMLRDLCASGGWLTVTNVISPLMSYLDRFIVGVQVSSAAVAYYATPQEIVTKLAIIPSALTAVLFPRFAGQIASGDIGARELSRRAVLTLACLVAPIALALLVGGELFLSMWISPSFASESHVVLSIFTMAMFLSCLATIPYTVLQSAGHYRATALMHCFELPLFLVALYILTTIMGIVGAAIAWFGRIVVDTAFMFLFAKWLVWRDFSRGSHNAKPVR